LARTQNTQNGTFRGEGAIMIKIMKTQADYEKALENIETLMDRDPKPGTPDANKLELLILLVKDYEAKNFPTESPDPVDAILFRMEQRNLTKRDLNPYIGSRSKVSEILSRKRQLTLSMIRGLHSGLGIPIKALIQERTSSDLEENAIDWNRFPIREMIKRGWIDENLPDIRNKAEDIICNFLEPLGSRENIVALYRMTGNVRSARPIDKYALMTWNARIMIRALKDPAPAKYETGTVNEDFMKNVAQLSVSDHGPRVAYDFLRNHGIPLIVEPHLPRTHLDGVAIMNPESPIIGLSLRYDRLDNFWFCLIHELAHIALHLGRNVSPFYDDLDDKNPNDPREQEADKLASEALIPEAEWKKSVASRLRTAEAAQHLANKLHIHPAIVAGRMRHFFKSYRVLNQLVGHKQVRIYFPEIKWS